MFAFPEAKRVRRKDLYDSASDSAASDEETDHDSLAESAVRAKLNAQLSGLFNLSFAVGSGVQQQEADQSGAQPQPQAPSPVGDVQHEGEHPEGEAFAFRLFRDEAPTHTVVLTHDEDPGALGDGAFVVPSRPHSYYIASAPSPGEVSEYRSVAVTAEYLLADAKKRRWGLEKPWRVIHIMPDSNSASSKSTPGPTKEEDSAVQNKRRTRPGKKHRIILRVREKAKREREEAMKKLLVDKEQHLQEKKKRLNRERKLKRRQKEREKKVGLQITSPDGGGADDDSQKDVDEES
ncbi:hypothetical protein E0Z10_g810 [Xylaria hypoxylon]|uniref:Uncharacterized protein n=1 Tax=Xylaria hypoxylon TaxID=37992 RepID=A0A4Z0Z6U0_9PEZI|nr:hypothetical protein E0Z10_g810 [Xylaria hypoxylon]